ncbi:MAG: FKBP-type peptidyl-prolyl cis-trans isomerase [Coriobacteriales bacterium]|nr:FKBP-type peptidyl-prolyl cis-trans isomerase [Coriobacteriales bacterium]
MRKPTRLLSTLTGFALAAVVGVSLFGCNGGNDTYTDISKMTSVDDATYTNVAATVDGVEIKEADVTTMIENMRKDTDGNIFSDVEWAGKLQDAKTTPAQLREGVIRNTLSTPILILNDAAALGISPDESVIDEQITQSKNQTGDPKAWRDYLHGEGFATEKAYRTLLEAQNVFTQVVSNKFSLEPTEDETLEFISTYGSYFEGKRSSAIVFTLSDTLLIDEARTLANEALNRIKAGEDFDTVAADFASYASAKAQAALAADPTSKIADMGWMTSSSSTSDFPDAYKNALNSLEVGQVYDTIVESDTAVYVIKCTDSFHLNADGTANMDTMPADVHSKIMDYLAQNVSKSRAEEYITNLTSDDTRIVINDMPAGLPYDSTMQLITDDVAGTGAEVKSGDTIRVTYVGTLDDGTVFDQSANHDGYMEFTVGSGQMIKGFDEDVVGMKVGGQRTIIIPPSKGYGSEASGAIPANSTLHFTIQLLSVNGDITGAESIISSLGLDFSNLTPTSTGDGSTDSSSNSSATDTSATDASSNGTSNTN